MTAGALSPVVAANVRGLRKARNWSAQQLADALTPHGVGLARRQAVSSWENGHRGLSVEELAALAAVFGIADPWSLTRPACGTCHGAPPTGFVCGTCGILGEAP